MTVVLKKCDNRWEADCSDLCGSPPVGRGKTRLEALSNLYLNLLFEYETWGSMIDFSFFKIIE